MRRSISIATRGRPKVYCASSTAHAAMWREWSDALRPRIDIVSTWHQSPSVEADEINEAICAVAWKENIRQITNDAHHMIVYANEGDRLQGTLVEVGMAIAMSMPIYIVGDYRWGTWRYCRFVYPHFTLHEALMAIVGYVPISALPSRTNDNDQTP